MNVLITIPHWSTVIPKDLVHEFSVSREHMNRHLDFGTEKIFDLPGFPVVKAPVSRFVVDVNRERDDLREGQGVIITETWDREQVLRHALSKDSIEKRLKAYYDPFYKKLDSCLRSLEKPLFVLDGHSMDSMGGLVSGDFGSERPEIDLVTGKGTCSGEILRAFEEGFKKQGFETARNTPYSGSRAKIIHYCAGHENVSALELEVNKKVYLDERTLEFKRERLERLRDSLAGVLRIIRGI